MPKKAVDKITHYMQDKLANEVTVEGLADVIGYSVNHFLKCFKAETGVTPHNFLVSLRLDRAQDILTNTRNRSQRSRVKQGSPAELI
jgi:AraC family transcriptional regulator